MLMKFQCNRLLLLKHTQWVEKAISAKTALPILSNLYLVLEENTLILKGHNLEIGISTQIPISNEEKTAGSFLVNAHLFLNIIHKIPDETIQLELVEQKKLILSTHKVKFDILGSTTDEYPAFPVADQGISVVLKAKQFLESIQHTIFSVSSDETKQFLNGILISSHPEGLSFVATDGFRLAFFNCKDQKVNENVSIIVPQKAVLELSKILQQCQEDASLNVTISENQLMIETNELTFFSRLIQGQFPDYNQVLPKETNFEFELNRIACLEAAQRAAIIAEHSNHIVKFNFTPTHLGFYSQAPSMGMFQEDIELKSEGMSETVVLSFNIKLVLDCLRVIQSDRVVFKFNNDVSPFVIESSLGDDEGTYIVMPIRTTEAVKTQVNKEAVVS